MRFRIRRRGIIVSSSDVEKPVASNKMYLLTYDTCRDGSGGRRVVAFLWSAPVTETDSRRVVAFLVEEWTR